MELQKIRNPLYFKLTHKSGFSTKMTSKDARVGLPASRPGLEFIPVRLADQTSANSEEKIEIHFPSGIQIVLTGTEALTMAESLISRR